MRILLLAAVAVGAWAQPPARPSFEVATIKRSGPCQGPTGAGPSPGRLDFPCMSMRSLIRIAHGAFTNGILNARRVEILGGPAWLDSERYDLSAKAEGRASLPDMMGPMLQALLEDRLQLKLHTETRESPVFALTLAGGNRKLKPATEASCTPIDLNNPPKPADKGPFCGGASIRINAGLTIADYTGVTMAELAGRMLPSNVGRPVVDQTGLEGRFDLHLEFARPETATMRLNGADVPAPPADTTGPSIFTALQEFGLKLSPAKGPVEVIVIDRVEKPSEN